MNQLALKDGVKAVIKTNRGDMEFVLFPQVAPKAVENFVTHSKNGYYNGQIFHRVIQDFMIQGGDPTGTGSGGSDQTIKGEFEENNVKNDLSHTRGVISMARNSISYNSASSQFFIVQQDSTYLDGSYAAFGTVTEGMEIVDAIAQNTPVEDSNGTVAKENQPVIETIRIID